MSEFFDWILDPSNYDPTYPLVAYFYLVIIAIVIHSILVVRPLVKLYYKFTKTRLKGMIANIEEMLTLQQKKDLIGFIQSEIIIMIFPGLMALVFRFLLGQPESFSWNTINLVIGIGLGFLWIILQFWQALTLKDLIQKLNKWYYNPTGLKFTLGGLNLTKKGLERFSEIEPNYIERENEEIQPLKKVITKNDKGSISLDGEATKDNLIELGKRTYTAIHNAGELVKSSVQKISKHSLEVFDDKVQSEVDRITKPSIYSRIQSYVVPLSMAFLPIFVIYIVLPTMG